MDLKKLQDNAQKELDKLNGAKLRLRGSKAYDVMIETYKTMIHRIEQLREAKGDNYELNELEVQEMRGYAERSEFSANSYLSTKDNLKKIKGNTQKRMDAAKGTKEFNKSFIEMLDARQDAIDRETAPSIPKLAATATDVHSRMVKADLNFRGSKAYGKAIEDFEKASNSINQLKQDMADPANPKLVDYAEIDEQIKILEKSKLSIDNYLSQKEDVTDAKTNTRKRIDAMRDGKNLINQTIKRLQTIKAGLEERPEKEIDELFGQTALTSDKLAEAKQGVRFGSKEYDAAEKAFNAVNSDLDTLHLNDKKNTVDLEPSERKAFNRKLNDAEEKIDKYLAKHRDDKNLGEKTRKRVEAMKKAKNDIIETKRRFNADSKTRNADAASFKDETLRQEENAVSEELQKAHLLAKRTGSEEFKKAHEKYNEAISSQASFDAEGGLKNHSREEIEEQIKALQDAQELNQKYLDKKKDIPEKKLGKTTKTRIDAITKANDQLEKRIEKMQAHIDNLDKLDKDAIKENHKDSTLILIAQRVSSVMGMDKILVMDNGEMAGLGTHAELMENCAAYRETYEMQTS